jgi:hypothetical protein
VENMAKKKSNEIVKKISLALTGIINLDNMEIEFEEAGVKPLIDLLKDFDGEMVKISIALTNTPDEQ